MRKPNGSILSNSFLSASNQSTPEECDLLIADDRCQTNKATNSDAEYAPDMAYDCADDECCASAGSCGNGDNKNNKATNINIAQPQNQRYQTVSVLKRILSYLTSAGNQKSRIFTLKHDWIFGGDASARSSNNKFAYNFLGNDPQLELDDKNETIISRPQSRSPPVGGWARFCLGRRSLSCLNITLLILALIGSCLLFAKVARLMNKLEENDGGFALALMLNLDKNALDDDRSGRWLVAQPKCHIPNINAWHKSIKGYVSVKESLNCDEIARESGVLNKSLTFVQDNLMYFTREALMKDAPSNCCVIEVTRPEEGDDKVEFNNTCIPLISPLLISLRTGDTKEPPPPLMQPLGSGWLSLTRLLRIECQLFNYTNVHSFIVHETEEEEALANVAKKQLDEDQYYNVVLLGIDTISRLNAERQLSKTLKTLRNRYKTLEFQGYNKVGENTFPNLIPFLTGLKPEQLTETQCWQASNYSQESETGDEYLDDCKYLWNYFQSLGYITYFNEDWPKASTFNYLKLGFKRQPTAYYGRPFTLARDEMLLPKVGMGCASCLRDKPIVGEDLEYLKSFIKEHSGRPYFAFHWINCPQHDDLNGASQVDHLIDKFLEDILDITQKENTFVIVFSDHGYRWEEFVSTRVGHYETSLPMMTIAPPKRFIENHPDLYENMKQHHSTLFTPFDMFKTLINIRELGRKSSSKPTAASRDGRAAVDSKEATKARNEELAQANEITFLDNSAARIESTTTFQQLKPITGLDYKQEFSMISLLDKPDPFVLNRSCIEAGIPDSYCVCHEFKSIKTQRSDVLGASYYLVYVHLFTRIKDHAEICHTLDLEKIHSAELFNFSRMKAAKKSGSARRRRSPDNRDSPEKSSTKQLTKVFQLGSSTTNRPLKTTPIPRYADGSVTQEKVIDEQRYLPNREYNIRYSTKPGSALFQEVIRYYGSDSKACNGAILKVRSLFKSNNSTLTPMDKYRHVQQMNDVCKFSVHSDSISRLNLYKTQSACVKNNIELKKVCYCRNNKQ